MWKGESVSRSGGFDGQGGDDGCDGGDDDDDDEAEAEEDTDDDVDDDEEEDEEDGDEREGERESERAGTSVCLEWSSNGGSDGHAVRTASTTASGAKSGGSGGPILSQSRSPRWTASSNSPTRLPSPLLPRWNRTQSTTSARLQAEDEDDGGEGRCARRGSVTSWMKPFREVV